MTKQTRKSGLFIPAVTQDNPLLESVKNEQMYDDCRPHLNFLSTKCVYNKSTRKYNVILKNGYVHEETSKNDALIRLNIEYAKYKIPNVESPITSDFVSMYRNFINPIMGFMPAPLCPPLFTWKNKTYVNSFEDATIISDEDLTNEDIIAFNRYVSVMARGLFGIVDYDMDYNKFIDIVVNGNFPERENNMPSKEELIYFFFSWVSAIYHRPGINLSTIPCFFGIPGTGKSTLANILCELLGNSDANLNQKQTSGNFNASLEGKILVCYNEVKDCPNFYNDIIKSTITESTISIERKGVDAYKVQNIINAILMSNNGQPFAIDSNDRRLIIIAGLTMEQNKQLSKQSETIEQQNTHLHDEDPNLVERIANIFAKIVPMIEVREILLNSGSKFVTPAKILMMQSYQTPIERFFEDSDVNFIEKNSKKTRTQLKRTSLKELEKLFKDWCDDQEGLGNVSANYSKTNQSFKNEVNKLAQEERFVYKDKSGILNFTDTFYDEYMQNNSNVVKLVTNKLSSIRGAH